MPTLDLDRVLAPIGRDAFLAEHWERQSLVIERHDASHYAGLVSTADVEQVIAFSHPRVEDPSDLAAQPKRTPSYVKGLPVARSGPDGQFPGVADFQRVYAQGKTVVIMGMQQRWLPVAALCRDLESIFFCPVHANLYLTPPGAQGFDAHFDTHEVFVLQLEGSKQWRLYGGPRAFPLVGERLTLEREELGAVREVGLEAGDLLYLPRGLVHEAFTSDSPSLHLTVGVNTYRWADLLHEALDRLTAGDERFRRSVPADALRDADAATGCAETFGELLAVLAHEARFADATSGLADQFVESLRPLPVGGFVPVAAEAVVRSDTVLEKAPGVVCRVVQSGAWVEIHFPGGRVGGPARIAPALRQVASAQRFVVDELPDALGEEGKRVLARRLVRERLLRIAAAPERAGAREV